jgi:hypothetical protein
LGQYFTSEADGPAQLQWLLGEEKVTGLSTAGSVAKSIRQFNDEVIISLSSVAVMESLFISIKRKRLVLMKTINFILKLFFQVGLFLSHGSVERYAAMAVKGLSRLKVKFFFFFFALFVYHKAQKV